MDQVILKFLPDFFRTKIEGRPNLQKILKNTGWLFADKIIRMGVGLLVGAWVARYLGPVQFGIYNYAVAFVALFTPFATLGLDGIVVRNILREPSLKEETLGTAFLLKLTGGILALFLTVSAVSFMRPADTLTRWLVGITAAGMIFQACDTIDFWFQSQVLSRYTVYARNGAFLIISLVKIALILAHAPLIAFAWAALAEIAVGAVGLIISYRINKQHLRALRVSLARAREMLRDSWPLILAVLSINVYMRIDQVMLGDMVGSKAVGVYTAAIKVSEIWYFIPTAIVSSVFPSIIQMKTKNEGLYYQRLQKLFNIMTAMSFSIAIPMTFLSTSVVTLLFGHAYGPSGPVLAVHIWAAVFVFLGLAQGPWDVSENLTTFSLVRTASGAFINIVLNFILIPKYSVIGAAIATVVAQACSAVILNSISTRTRVIFIKQMQSFLFFRRLIT
jgi:PST family polysaccharide transporter